MEHAPDPLKTGSIALLEVLEGLPDATVGATRDGRIVFVNGLAEEQFGYGRDELLGQPIETLWPERVRGRYRRNLDLYFELEHPLRFTERAYGRRKDGSEFIGEMSWGIVNSEDGPLLLALFVHGRCLEKWERTEDYTRIDDVLDALGVVVGAGLPAWRAPTSHAQMLDIIVRQARVVAVAMTVEDGMSCSCPVAVGDRARVVVDALGAVLAEEGALGDDLQDLREVVRTDATTTRRYFDTIARVADAVGTFVEQEVPGPVDDIDDVLVALGAPALFEGDVYESELRAHRAALIALRDSAREPRLNVDAAELVYLYPFALDGITGDEAVARARRGVIASTLATLGLESAGAEDLDVNDLWDVPDAREPGYGGASIELPPLRVKTTADEWLDDFDVEIRLSRLGNHHLRVRSRLANAGLHEVNQALRRGSHAMGKEQFDPAVLDCRTFREYADTIIRTVADAVQADAVRNLTSQFHVVVGARAISVRDATGGTPTATLTDLERAVGSTLLFHPVRHLATALEEWIRYPRSMMRNLLADEGFAGDLVARTDNTTITFMPSSPEWLVDEYEEMVEFVASIPPLLTLWEKEASRLARLLTSSRPRPRTYG